MSCPTEHPLWHVQSFVAASDESACHWLTPLISYYVISARLAAGVNAREVLLMQAARKKGWRVVGYLHEFSGHAARN